MSKSAPPSPDFKGAAEATAASNQAATNTQTQANRPNQQNDFGSSQWAQDANGNWTQSQSMNEGMQGLLQQAQNNAGSPVNFGQFGGIQSGSDAQQNAANYSFRQSQSRLDPQWDQRASSLRSQLYNQGLREGDELFQQEMDNFSRNRNDAYQGAMNSAQMLGVQAGHNAFGDSMQGRQQQIAEMLQQRNMSMDDLLRLLQAGGMASGSMPGFQGAGNAGGTDYAGAAGAQYGADMDAYNAQQAQQQAWMSGIGGLAGGLFGL
ncbi:MAG TPA: hypothetical protein DCQ64_06230 [Candidatus Rokubacteria bacterium]|nr:hypothetical protein [Candidatus Rokubacteria bacterium]